MSPRYVCFGFSFLRVHTLSLDFFFGTFLAQTKWFVVQLVQGLQFLHKYKLMHRDLKPQNLLLEESKFDTTLKIADFGFARSIEPDTMAATLCGTPLYMVRTSKVFFFSRVGCEVMSVHMRELSYVILSDAQAPEILRHDKYDSKADLWSLGTIIFEMITGNPPFAANNPKVR
jgi:serine/threonine-protein kinase ULK/ATG1